MEIFTECLVKKQPSIKDTLLKLLIAFAAVILSIAAFLICASIQVISFLGIFFAAGIVYGAWVLLRSFSVEYEYILTNGELDVDKITSQSRRKRLTTLDFKNIEIMAPVKESYRREYENDGIQKKIFASDGNPKTEYFIKYPGKDGLTVLRFTPDERIIKGAKQFSPRKVFEA